MDNISPKGNEAQLPNSLHLNLPNRMDLTNATLNNLISLGILLRAEAERYRIVLNNYDYSMLFKTFLFSNEIKALQPFFIS